MIHILKKTSLRNLLLLASISCSIVVCFLLYFFARDVDKVYSDLIDRDVKARAIIQSIFTQRLNNASNIIKIETATNADTIDVFLNKWYKKSLEIDNAFDSLRLIIPKDSSRLSNELVDVIIKRKIVIDRTKKILTLEKNNPSINVLDSIKIDADLYHKSINSFLETYNTELLKTNLALTRRTIKKSTLYLAILPVPLICLFIIFIGSVIIFLKDFSKE